MKPTAAQKDAIIRLGQDSHSELRELEAPSKDATYVCTLRVQLPYKRTTSLFWRAYELDLEFRRAIGLASSGESRPIRPELGGAEMQTASAGSLDYVASLYGLAEQWATLHPIVTGLALALALGAGPILVRIVRGGRGEESLEIEVDTDGAVRINQPGNRRRHGNDITRVAIRREDADGIIEVEIEFAA